MDTLPDYLLNNYCFYKLIDNFSELLLCKINVLDIFDIGDFFQIFVLSRNTEIVIE